jgi:hypothetical protein
MSLPTVGEQEISWKNTKIPIRLVVGTIQVPYKSCEVFILFEDFFLDMSETVGTLASNVNDDTN